MTRPLYRDNGAVGALLDEYEKAVSELKALITTVTSEELKEIVDPLTEDQDCRSIQTVLTHVVGAGVNYAITIRRHLGESIEFTAKVSYENIADYIEALKTMFAYNVQLFEDYPDLILEVFEPEKKILSNWGQRYDVEQLYEHAIVHILRHRRQIERFLLKLRILS